VSVVFAIANQKGGVGKTTTTISLGAGLASRGRRVLIVDADPQANATSALGQAQGESGGLYEALVDEQPLEPALTPTGTEGLWLIPTTPNLSGAEVELVSVMAREFRMKRAMEPMRQQFDFVLIDCPPSLGLLTVNALAAADEVIIPVQAEYLALEGLGHLAGTIELVRRNLNPRLKIRGVILTMYDSRTNLARQVEEEVRRHFSETFRSVIPRSIRLAEAPSHGEPIQRYDAASPGAVAYNALAEELLEQLAERLSPLPAAEPASEAPETASRAEQVEELAALGAGGEAAPAVDEAAVAAVEDAARAWGSWGGTPKVRPEDELEVEAASGGGRGASERGNASDDEGEDPFGDALEDLLGEGQRPAGPLRLTVDEEEPQWPR
jgi:chromosome partitioning protein